MLRISFFYITLIISFVSNVYAAKKENISFETHDSSFELSHLCVRSFCQDSLGYMWIATARGLNRSNSYELKQYFYNKEDLNSLDNNMIFSLFLDSKQRLWVGTSTGVNRYDFDHDHFIRYKISNSQYILSFTEDYNGNIWVATSSGIGIINNQKQRVEIINNDQLSLSTISTLVEDKAKILWAGTSEGLAYKSKNNEWEFISLNNNCSVTSICVDPQGNFILGTNSGIQLFNPETRSIIKTPNELINNSINNAYIHFIHEIKPLKYLIGTATDGLFLYDALRQNIIHNPYEYTKSFNAQEPLCCYKDKDNNIWIGSFDNGFTVTNPSLNIFNRDYTLSNTFKGICTTKIIEDKFENLWIGTRYQGLYFYGKDKNVKQYTDIKFSLLNKNSNLIEELFIDSNDNLWIVFPENIVVGKIDKYGGLHIKHKISHNGIGSATIIQDNQNNIWLGLSSGLYIIRDNDIYSKLERVYTGNISKVCLLADGQIIFSVFGKGIYSIDSNTKTIKIIESPTIESQAITKHCIDIFEDSQNRIWLGSYNEGLMYMKGNMHKILTEKDGLPCNDITCIKEDNNRNIWLSTANGISCINEKFSLSNFFIEDGIGGNLFHEKASLLRSNGQIFFTGNHGLTFFNPQLIHKRNKKPNIIIENLYLKNNLVLLKNNDINLKKQISYTDSITLTHKHSVITFEYTSIDFSNSNEITYAYKLEGFDDKWNYVGKHRRATYSNISPGNYIFMVKAIFNNNNEYISTPTMLHISVKPAPWLTWWAWCVYMFILVSFILFLTNLRIKVKVNRERLINEMNKHKREQEIYEMKINFFTNISHEFRTPLTLILAPIQQLIANINPQSENGKLLATINQSGQNLYKLMNQLLDFRKLEDGKISLLTKQDDIIHLLYKIVDNYNISASYKKIKLEISFQYDHFDIWYDSDKIEKIMHNLLSNAMKYTPQNGIISITAKEIGILDATKRYKIDDPYEKYIEITVLNNGPKIPLDKLNKIFDRYQQIETVAGFKPNYPGSGIGLNYAKQLTEIHKGQIIAELQKERGMSFSFILPLGDIYENIEKSDYQPINEVSYLYNINNSYCDIIQNQQSKKKEYTILIVEDNFELNNFLCQMLENNYNIINATNGAKAWEILQNEYADLVLSDVVMPELSGYDLCKKIKQDKNLSHISVILLTAKVSMSSQLEGLKLGAEAYLCKPFNVQYLSLLISNLLNNRSKLLSFYSIPKSKINQDNLPPKLNKLDEEFMNKFTELLNNELSNTELNIDDIACKLAYSRTSFYRKLKGLTNIAPNDFIRNYRLKRAAELIEEGSLSLFEIAENTGFCNYPHFSTLFKKHFGASPRDYKNISKIE